MSILEEIKSMKSQGMNETSIIENLQQKGVSYKEISDALSQSKIKAAVEENSQDSNNFEIDDQPQKAPEFAGQLNEQQYQQSLASPTEGMQRSMMSTSQQPTQQNYEEVQEYSPQTPNDSQYQDQYQEQYQSYPQESYDYTPQGMSPDLITEIAEQIISEKLSDVRKKLEKTIDFKTTMESKVEILEDRLKRIEKIIDTLQTSVLKKVGDYGSNIEDIKKELIETQKSFSKIIPELKKHKKK